MAVALGRSQGPESHDHTHAQTLFFSPAVAVGSTPLHSTRQSIGSHLFRLPSSPIFFYKPPHKRILLELETAAPSLSLLGLSSSTVLASLLGAGAGEQDGQGVSAICIAAALLSRACAPLPHLRKHRQAGRGTEDVVHGEAVVGREGPAGEHQLRVLQRELRRDPAGRALLQPQQPALAHLRRHEPLLRRQRPALLELLLRRLGHHRQVRPQLRLVHLLLILLAEVGRCRWVAVGSSCVQLVARGAACCCELTNCSGMMINWLRCRVCVGVG